MKIAQVQFKQWFWNGFVFAKRYFSAFFSFTYTTFLNKTKTPKSAIVLKYSR